MAPRPISERLQAGDVLMIDGATGTELDRRGIDVFRGFSGDPADLGDLDQWAVSHAAQMAAADRYLAESDPSEMRRVHEEYLKGLGPWSAPANVDAPDVVRSIHEDYLRAGADIIISNNFYTSRSKLERIGLGEQWDRYTRAAAELAIEARDAVNPEAYVLGGMAPGSDVDLRLEFAEVAQLLAAAGVDAILAEYLGAIDECVAAVEACAHLGLPLLLGVRHVSAQGTMQYLETFEALARALDGAPVTAILLMCSAPENVSAALPNLRGAFELPVGAYSHPPDAADGAAVLGRFAAYGREWLDAGAQIVGGCCGTSPPHIEALSEIVHGR
jgi:methionine synthase I (cobalamin-dependent)